MNRVLSYMRTFGLKYLYDGGGGVDGREEILLVCVITEGLSLSES